MAVRAAGRQGGVPGCHDADSPGRCTEWLAEEAHPGEKIVLWAHNSHVANQPWAFGKSMGMWLRERFGAQMYITGFAIYRGSFATTAHAVFEIPTGVAGSGDVVLKAAGMPLLFLDLRAVPPASPLGRWASAPQFFLAGGAGQIAQAENAMDELTPAKAFDGMVFIDAPSSKMNGGAGSSNPESVSRTSSLLAAGFPNWGLPDVGPDCPRVQPDVGELTVVLNNRLVFEL